MWEVFSFINPIGNHCLKTEQTIIEFANKHNIKAHFRFIALSSFQTVNNYIQNNNFDIHNIDLRNEITQKTYRTTLLYKAATLQGNKKARAFLMSMQNALNVDNKEFNNQLAYDISQEVGLNWEALEKDSHSDLILKQCFADQQRASELGVSSTPSTIIYDYSKPCDESGVFIDRCSIDDLDSLMDNLVKSDQIAAQTPDLHIVE
ncbi:DsbA family protein [Bombilactobacillus thymidiniphilus]|uniref:DsbA family protein n=1 Tax=Bombilactobacillus thymidiniphilus TaxID=2923363 RepID=A0ABY4PC63_9LACO|nr:DsbA family protein [Bombilactobacillus thymidiniphilus]UQS83276.1 DsbA family protein [Bombilactobacillus thymidiniphilus]